MDIGVTVLGMHSARETMGSDDQDAINRLMTVFFE
jgi:aspartyl aminopeptidase